MSLKSRAPHERLRAPRGPALEGALETARGGSRQLHSILAMCDKITTPAANLYCVWTTFFYYYYIAWNYSTNPRVRYRLPGVQGSEMWLRGRSVRSRCDGSSDRSFMVDPLSYFSFQPVLHDWRNMCYHVCGMMHIKNNPCC